MTFEVANLGAKRRPANETIQNHCVLAFPDISFRHGNLLFEYGLVLLSHTTQVRDLHLSHGSMVVGFSRRF
jgi:hypothetical protein